MAMFDQGALSEALRSAGKASRQRIDTGDF